MRPPLPAVALVVVPGILAPPALSGEFTICNKEGGGDRGYVIAMIERHEDFEASGWHRIDPGACQSFGLREYQAFYTLSVVEDTAQGHRVGFYGAEDGIYEKLHTRSGTYGTQEFFCVGEQAFRRNTYNLNDFRTCQPGEYLQLFNVFVYVAYDSGYTLNLE